ncbi:MAG: ferredoxin [Acidimicrobiales bacterium]
MRVQIDSQRCQGHGRCYSLAPEVYDCDDEGYGTVRVADLPDALEGQATLGEQSCPESAITTSPS